jgi:CxxC-x17-CxxC domain-containing protein
MEFQDKSLTCVDCGTEFIWTAGEQLFFADKQFKNEPKRCKACKGKRAMRAGSSSSNGPGGRVETKATCSACGKETTVPFRPTQGRPVFCKDCFQQRRAAGAGG